MHLNALKSTACCQAARTSLQWWCQASTPAKWDSVSSLFAARFMSMNSGDEGGREPPERIPRAGKYRSAWKILKEEVEGIGTMKPPGMEIPRECDVLIVGGGVIGSAVAYWIKERNPKGSNVVIVERDPMYTRASTMLSAGGIRHQFSIPENVQLSLFATEFFKNIKERLSVIHESPPDISFNHQGYMFLAAPRNAERLVENVKMQNELGAKIALLTKNQLAEKFPWLNLDGVECGSLGLEGEGWIDPWSLLRAFKQKNISLGTKYVHGELINFEFLTKQDHGAGDRNLRLDSGVIRAKDGSEHEIRFCVVVNCAGPWAADVAELAKIGLGDEELVFPLPVEPRKRFVYVVHCPQGPMLDFPFTVDQSGLYVRREGYGGHYICGKSPSEEQEPDIANFEVDYDFYDEELWPSLARRIPAFNNSKLRITTAVPKFVTHLGGNISYFVATLHKPALRSDQVNHSLHFEYLVPAVKPENAIL
ncbi:FAD-dependent oxidoreductase domain-containing protein 1 [Plakobranchus ocellatus]|uniref:FAD-dependent oxidoreductase domain-containing protein 1 n=2 Tax=Plakobranchus ocellatus TaxID=259542 RepID=A0AAV4DYY5_9GAST|nr:FAD-dependent oxidoreductase domain-containing protein 1 [Plakobranchus ocellatus]